MSRRSNIIWTKEVRAFLYQQLVRKFGPVSTWEKRTKPAGRELPYRRFLGDFARMIGASSAAAVQMQISYAMQDFASNIDGGRIQCFILNKAAALEAGFIEDSELPELTASPRTAAA